jgi:6-pyruvoyltetrahydropterin/6-carboxytetrahydropterin synthase
MSVIRVTKEFTFEMAHALYGYNGACRNIHGHSYKLSVCIKGEVRNKKGDPKNGMVVDFTDLKEIVKTQIIDKLDHALVLNGDSPHESFANNKSLFEKIVLVKYQPTCENLLIDFVNKLRPFLTEGLKLHHLKLRETSSSYAEWFDDEN